MAQMATTVYLPSLPVVMRELKMTQGGAELSISAYVIGAALPVPFWGAAAERWGRRGPLLISLLLFVASSLLLAVCTVAPALLALRAIQGIGAAARRSSPESSSATTGAATNWRDGCRCCRSPSSPRWAAASSSAG